MPARDYQTEAIICLRTDYDLGYNRLLGHAATGLGKGYLIPEIIAAFPELAEFGVFINVHRREIAMQTIKHLRRLYPNKSIGMEMGSEAFATDNDDFVVAMIPTLGRDTSERITKFRRPRGIIINDETHHATDGNTWDNVLNWFGVGSDSSLHRTLPGGLKPLSVGLTATPTRNDGKGLLYDVVPHTPHGASFSFDILYGIRNGWLVEPKSYQVKENPQQRPSDPEQIFEHEVNLTIKAILDYGLNLKTMIFAQSVQHSLEIVRGLQALGYTAAHVDGGTEDDVRREIVRGFSQYDAETGEGIQYVSNYGVFTEGFDDKGIQCIVMARSTESQPLYVQMMGRGLRPNVDLPVDSTPEERKRLIAESDKPVCHVIDLVWVTSALSLVTVPSLFELKRDFDAGGKRIVTEVVDVLEEIEAEQPERPVRDVSNINELDLAISAVDVWNGTVYNEEIKQISPLRWIHEKQGDTEHYSLYLPVNPDAKRAFDKTPMIIRFEKLPGQEAYEAIRIDVGGWVTVGRKSFPKRSSVEVQGHFAAEELKRRMNEVDRWVSHKNPDIFRLLRRDVVSAHKPASADLLAKLKNRGIKHSPDITQVTAQILLDAHRISEKLNKLGTIPDKIA